MVICLIYQNAAMVKALDGQETNQYSERNYAGRNNLPRFTPTCYLMSAKEKNERMKGSEKECEQKGEESS